MVQESTSLGTVDVVDAVILDKGKFLAEKRKANERIDSEIVCLLEGHVEPKETKDSALMREMKEELNAEVKKLKLIKRSSWVASNGERQNVHYFLVLAYEGKPICRAAEEILWRENNGELDIETDR
jgi:8-oxo-dGTP pyrophosphatase MutT (NUDIX family)